MWSSHMVSHIKPHTKQIKVGGSLKKLTRATAVANLRHNTGPLWEHIFTDSKLHPDSPILCKLYSRHTLSTVQLYKIQLTCCYNYSNVIYIFYCSSSCVWESSASTTCSTLRSAKHAFVLPSWCGMAKARSVPEYLQYFVYLYTLKFYTLT